MDQEGDEHANSNNRDEYPLSNFSSRANTFGATCPTVSPFAVGPSSTGTFPNSVAHPLTPYRNGQTIATPSSAVIGAKKLIIRNFKHQLVQKQLFLGLLDQGNTRAFSLQLTTEKPPQ
uniref:Uncharacterized protein n=1 Tax=Parascaris equorum TaxID=6256 RepID=A0A914S3I3_PAREQ